MRRFLPTLFRFRSRRRRTDEQRGVAAMEFTMWLPAMMLVVAGTVDGSFYMASQHTLARAARDGARVGANTLEPFPATGALITAAAKTHTENSLTWAGVSGATVTTAWTVDGDGIAHIDVTVTHTYLPFFSGFQPFSGTRDYVFSMMTQEQP